jgi:hypothetical protein
MAIPKNNGIAEKTKNKEIGDMKKWKN